jgi:hypothetical protein
MLVAAVALRIFLHGIHARGRAASRSSACSPPRPFGAFAWTVFDPRPEILSARRAGARGDLGRPRARGDVLAGRDAAEEGLAADDPRARSGSGPGPFAALLDRRAAALPDVEVGALPADVATLTSWFLAPFYSKNKGFVQHGSRRFPSVRFPCLALRDARRLGPGPSPAARTAASSSTSSGRPTRCRRRGRGQDVTIKRRSRNVAFPCPSCREPVEWIQGDNACPKCNLKLSMHWSLQAKKGV